jgi:PhnB protein
MAFRPYLFFGGTCRDAFTRYQEIFGGELTVMTMKDVPGETPPPGMENQVIHAAIVNGDDTLMGSDEMGESSGSFGPVQGMMVTYDAADDTDAKRVFEALAEGGTVTQELMPTFFSSNFGMCTDRFGTPWMIVAPDPNQQS